MSGVIGLITTLGLIYLEMKMDAFAWIALLVRLEQKMFPSPEKTLKYWSHWFIIGDTMWIILGAFSFLTIIFVQSVVIGFVVAQHRRNNNGKI